MTCLTAGRAVLCEKPFTLDRASSEELIDTARDRGVFLMEAMWMRCNPLILRVCELVRDGAIGEVTTVRADFGIAGPFPPEHRLRARELGGGALLDLGVYPVSFAHLILGMPDEIHSWAALTPEGVDENTAVIFGYASNPGGHPSGAVASLTCSLTGSTPVTATITGTAGRIELSSPFFRPNHATLRRSGHDPERLPADTVGTGYHYEAAEVQRCLAAGLLESPLVPHAATLEVMGLLDTVRAHIDVTYV
jgi:predicted dehydrogenase